MKIIHYTTSTLCFRASFNCHPQCVKAPFPILQGWFLHWRCPDCQDQSWVPSTPPFALERAQGGQAGREVTLHGGGCPCNATCSAPLAEPSLGEAALLMPPDEPSSALWGTGGQRRGFPYSSHGQTDCHVLGNRYTGTAKCLAYHLSWIFKWYKKGLCLIPGCLMDLRGRKSMPLVREHRSVFSLPLSTDQSLQAATVSFTVQMAISSTYLF